MDKQRLVEDIIKILADTAKSDDLEMVERIIARVRREEKNSRVKTWKPIKAPVGHEAEFGYYWPSDLGQHDFCFECPNCHLLVYGLPPPEPCPVCQYFPNGIMNATRNGWGSYTA